MSITVLRPGLLTTIQDAGRYGYQKYGVIASGAMDLYGLRLANILVGNPETEAVLEITLAGPALQFNDDRLIAITGGDLSPEVNGFAVPLWRPVYLKKGSVLRFGACKSGCRAYLAVAGGYHIDNVMGSKSTYLRAGIGGFNGRALQASDHLALNPPGEQSDRFIQHLGRRPGGAAFTAAEWYASHSYIREVLPAATVRVVRGEQFELFDAGSVEQFLQGVFQVSTQSDRMGYRLNGPSMRLKEAAEMISEAVSLGTIQVPPDGNPIILLADRQTAGGYPKIAQVVSGDVDKLAQVKPGGKIRFKEITLEEAERLYMEKELMIGNLHTAVRLKLS